MPAVFLSGSEDGVPRGRNWASRISSVLGVTAGMCSTVQMVQTLRLGHPDIPGTFCS